MEREKRHYRLINITFTFAVAAFMIVAMVAQTRVQASDSPPLLQHLPSDGVLPSSQFSGLVSQAYSVAEQHPAVLAKVFCYCGCDRENNHESLLDCFRSMHGVACATCRAEALTVGSLLNEHKTVSDIERTIDGEYAHSYASEHQSISYRHYQESKLY